MLHAPVFAGLRRCLYGMVPSASKIVLDQTDGCASDAQVYLKVRAPLAAKGRNYLKLFARGNKLCRKGSVFVALLIGNGISVLGLIKERFLVVAILHVSALCKEVHGGWLAS
jgi:hypothetical protein